MYNFDEEKVKEESFEEEKTKQTKKTNKAKKMKNVENNVQKQHQVTRKVATPGSFGRCRTLFGLSAAGAEIR